LKYDDSGFSAGTGGMLKKNNQGLYYRRFKTVLKIKNY